MLFVVDTPHKAAAPWAAFLLYGFTYVYLPKSENEGKGTLHRRVASRATLGRHQRWSRRVLMQ